mmetsp:Transcript_66318/g.104908  ORF Transcript_66318/g.104908 Transcript_66318/m.104908 type:complete len:301 (+) Transcript_66318:108-1010(+)
MNESFYPPAVPGSPLSSPLPGGFSPFATGGPGVGVFPPGPSVGPGQSFLTLFGGGESSLQEIADKCHQLQQKIDENAELEKANLRTAAEQKHLEIERHAAELARHAANSIEAYKTVQLQTAERQKAYQQAVVRQQAEQAKRLIDQQAAQAIAAVENRERQMTLQRQQQELVQRGAPQFLAPLGAPLPFAGPLDFPPPPLGRYEARPPPMAVAGVDTNHDGRPNYLYVGADRNLDGVPDALQAIPPRAPHMAMAGVDSNFDGRPNYYAMGVDRNFDGIPDALQAPYGGRRHRSPSPLPVGY